jgi:YfiH family protein
MMFDMEPMILPSIEGPFEWRTAVGGPVLICTALEPYAAHFFTTRAWALGDPVSLWRDGTAWSSVAAAAGLPEERLIRAQQVHGADVVIARAGAALATGDIIISNDAELAIAVQTADCVPLLIADTRTGAVCAAHAGWRGIAARVPQLAARSLAAQSGSPPHDFVAALGPSIGACCYEVGADVREAMLRLHGDGLDPSTWFHSRPVVDPDNPPLSDLSSEGRHGRWYFDGWAAVVAQLVHVGMEPEKIAVARVCTASHPSACCSYRRDGAASGRLAAVLRKR